MAGKAGFRGSFSFIFEKACLFDHPTSIFNGLIFFNLEFSDSLLCEDYFERLLEEIREIRLSERRFYQKITDIYATSVDYNKDAPTTKAFFAKVQNKPHFAIHGKTAAELIMQRADSRR